MTLLQQLEAYQPVNEQEQADKQLILSCLKHNEAATLTRENKVAHLTASGFVVNETFDKVLMVYHHLFKSFTWTGGHADGDANLLNVAMKEACEETGIKDVKPLTHEIVAIDALPVWRHMKRGEFISSHLHLNATYLLVADESQPLTIKADENSDVSWINIDEIEKYCTEPDMLPVYQKVIQQLDKIKGEISE